MNISEIVGMTFSSISMNEAKDEIVFAREDGTQYKMFHNQDCCECVVVEDLEGELSDLEGAPILYAEESTQTEAPEGSEPCDDSNLWTFYRIRTIKGSIVIRWHGSSNGYYGESVDFEKLSTASN